MVQFADMNGDDISDVVFRHQMTGALSVSFNYVDVPQVWVIGIDYPVSVTGLTLDHDIAC